MLRFDFVLFCQIASAAALLNLTRILLEKSDHKEVVELGPREDALRALISSLRSIESFSAHSPLALTRLLQTLIVLLGREGTGQTTTVTNSLRIDDLQALAEATRRIKDAVTDDDVKALARELSEMIGAL